MAVSVAWHKPDAVLHEFALDRPEVSFEYADEGVFHSARAIRAAIFAALQPLRTGEMIEVHAASPLIEVARDLRSARALFSTPGYGALPREGGLPMATWNWGMLAADFMCLIRMAHGRCSVLTIFASSSVPTRAALWTT